jgi:hypothetical protein
VIIIKTVEEAIRNYNTRAPIGMKRWIKKRSDFLPRWAENTGKFHGITVGPITREKYESAVGAKTEKEMVNSVTDKGAKLFERAKEGLQV